MLYSPLSLILLAAFTRAQSSTVSLFLLDSDPQTLVASVISADASTTQYLVGCPAGEDANNCGYDPAMTVMQAGSVYGASVTAPADGITLSYECTLYTSDGTSAVCTESLGGSAANDPGVQTTTLSGTDISFLPVTITAGLDKISAAATASASVTGSASASATGTSSTGTSSGSVTGSASATSGTAAAGAGEVKARAGLGLVGAVAAGLFML